MTNGYEPIKHYRFNIRQLLDSYDFSDDLSTTIYTINESIMAKVVDTHDKTIVDAVLAVAIAENIDHLYVMDKKFVLDALKEKLIRDGYVGGDTNDVSTNSGDT